jgi:flagellar assembly protein FliH
MKWYKAFTPGQPLHNVRITGSMRPPETVHAQCAGDPTREQAAFERGLAEGEKRLGEQLLRQRTELLELQNGVLASLREAVPQVVRQSESALIQLALEAVQKLVGDLPVSAGMVEAAVRSALAQVEASAEFHVYLHTDDLALLQKCNSPVLLPAPGNEAMRFQASPEVTRGGCLVQTRFGVVDARRETKLELIRQSLKT